MPVSLRTRAAHVQDGSIFTSDRRALIDGEREKEK